MPTKPNVLKRVDEAVVAEDAEMAVVEVEAVVAEAEVAATLETDLALPKSITVNPW